MSDFSSSKIKESSSSMKMSSSSVSSSKVSSSSISSSMASDIDDLLAASASARDSARSIASGLGSRLTSDLAEIDSLLGSSSLGSSSISSSSVSSSSSAKKSTLSSISQSSLDSDGTCKASVKSHSSSSATSAMLKTKSESVDGETVSAETIAEKASRKAESGKEKVIEDGHVVTNTGFNVEQTSQAKLRATKEMSGAELDSFFRQPAISGKPAEALNFDKASNSFEMKLVDLPEFSPQDLSVKIVDGVITIVGHHEEQLDDKTFKSHQYIRRFTVPQGLNTDNVAWDLEPSGVLAIKAGDQVKSQTSQVHLDCTIFKPRSFFKKK